MFKQSFDKWLFISFSGLSSVLLQNMQCNSMLTECTWNSCISPVIPVQNRSTANKRCKFIRERMTKLYPRRKFNVLTADPGECLSITLDFLQWTISHIWTRWTLAVPPNALIVHLQAQTYGGADETPQTAPPAGREAVSVSGLRQGDSQFARLEKSSELQSQNGIDLQVQHLRKGV